MSADTSAEAVEMQHHLLEECSFYVAADLLRALLRERDEARADRDSHQREAIKAMAAIATARADALREAADVAERLRDAWAASRHNQRGGVAYAEAIHAAIVLRAKQEA